LDSGPSIFSELITLLQAAKIFYDLTVFVIYSINVTKFIFPVIHLKAIHLTGQMTSQLKVCPDKMVTLWLDIVH